jgi:hypothetical protein
VIDNCALVIDNRGPVIDECGPLIDARFRSRSKPGSSMTRVAR